MCHEGILLGAGITDWRWTVWPFHCDVSFFQECVNKRLNMRYVSLALCRCHRAGTGTGEQVRWAALNLNSKRLLVCSTYTQRQWSREKHVTWKWRRAKLYLLDLAEKNKEINDVTTFYHLPSAGFNINNLSEAGSRLERGRGKGKMVCSSLVTWFSFKNKMHLKFQENDPTVNNVERFEGKKCIF